MEYGTEKKLMEFDSEVTMYEFHTGGKVGPDMQAYASEKHRIMDNHEIFLKSERKIAFAEEEKDSQINEKISEDIKYEDIMTEGDAIDLQQQYELFRKR